MYGRSLVGLAPSHRARAVRAPKGGGEYIFWSAGQTRVNDRLGVQLVESLCL